MANRTLFNVTVQSKVFGQKPTSSYRKLLDSLMTNLIEDPKTTAKVLGIKLKSQMNIKKFNVEHKTMTISGHTNTMNLKVINRNIERIVDSLITPSGEKYIIKNYVLESMNDEEYSRIHESEDFAELLDITGIRDGFRLDFNDAMKELPFLYCPKSAMLVTDYPTTIEGLRTYFGEFGFIDTEIQGEYFLPMPHGVIRCRVLDYDTTNYTINVAVFDAINTNAPLATLECKLDECVDLMVLIIGFSDNQLMYPLKRLHSEIGRYWSPFLVDKRFFGFKNNSGKKLFVIPTLSEEGLRDNFDQFFDAITLGNYPVAYYKNSKFKRFITFSEFEEMVKKPLGKEANDTAVAVDTDSDEVDEVLDITMPRSFLTTNTLPDYTGSVDDISKYVSLFKDGLIEDIQQSDESIICKTRFNETIIISPTELDKSTVFVEFIDADTYVYASKEMKLREVMDLYIIYRGLHHIGLYHVIAWVEQFYQRYKNVCAPLMTDYHMGFYNDRLCELYCIRYDDSDVNIVFDIKHDLHDTEVIDTKSPEEMCEYIDKLGE